MQKGKWIDSYVCVDLETSGLDAKNDKIIEIGAIRMENGKKTGEFSSLINPAIQISPQITSLTGISNSMLKGQPYIDEVLPEFIEFCKDHILLGHNLFFDYSFLRRNAINLGMDFERKGIDTLKIARSQLADLEKRSLEYLCHYYGIQDSNHHRAMNDVQVTVQLYEKLAEEFYEKNPELFLPKEFLVKVKKQSPITEKQKKYLEDLLSYHGLSLDREIGRMNKSEASREIDFIILNYGKIR